jgi:hypothetical protein
MQPGEVGKAANGDAYEANLGNLYFGAQGKKYRLCKAAAALATMGRALVGSAGSSGLPTFIVNTTTTAADPLGIGGCVSTQVDIAIGDYFLVQTGGYGELISAAAIVLGASVGASTTAKKVDDATMTDGGTTAVALESAAGADENVAVRFIRD